MRSPIRQISKGSAIIIRRGYARRGPVGVRLLHTPPHPHRLGHQRRPPRRLRLRGSTAPLLPRLQRDRFIDPVGCPAGLVSVAVSGQGRGALFLECRAGPYGGRAPRHSSQFLGLDRRGRSCGARPLSTHPSPPLAVVPARTAFGCDGAVEFSSGHGDGVGFEAGWIRAVEVAWASAVRVSAARCPERLRHADLSGPDRDCDRDLDFALLFGLDGGLVWPTRLTGARNAPGSFMTPRALSVAARGSYRRRRGARCQMARVARSRVRVKN